MRVRMRDKRILQKWFAWHPVYVVDSRGVKRLVWLETVYRMMDEIGDYLYILPEDL